MFYINKQAAQYGWVVYSLTAPNTSEPDFIWYCKLGNIGNIIDAVKNPDFNTQITYTLHILEHCPDKMTAYNSFSRKMKENGMPPLNMTHWANRRQPVRCDNTGQIFKNANEAATLLGLNRSQLSQHLRRQPGYKSIKGMTFSNISVHENVQPSAIQFPPIRAPQPMRQGVVMGRMPTVEDFNLDVSIQPRQQ